MPRRITNSCWPVAGLMGFGLWPDDCHIDVRPGSATTAHRSPPPLPRGSRGQANNSLASSMVETVACRDSEVVSMRSRVTKSLFPWLGRNRCPLTLARVRVDGRRRTDYTRPSATHQPRSCSHDPGGHHEPPDARSPKPDAYPKRSH